MGSELIVSPGKFFSTSENGAPSQGRLPQLLVSVCGGSGGPAASPGTPWCRTSTNAGAERRWDPGRAAGEGGGARVGLPRNKRGLSVAGGPPETKDAEGLCRAKLMEVGSRDAALGSKPRGAGSPESGAGPLPLAAAPLPAPTGGLQPHRPPDARSLRAGRRRRGTHPGACPSLYTQHCRGGPKAEPPPQGRAGVSSLLLLLHPPSRV